MTNKQSAKKKRGPARQARKARKASRPGRPAEPREGPKRFPFNSLYILLGAVLIYAIGALVLMPYVPDDAYISFRYAEHLAGGEGLTFNRGENPVEGYSNLLWIFVCMMFYKLGFSLPTAMPYVGALLGALCLVVLWKIYKRTEVPAFQMAIPLILFAGSGPFVLYAVSGMETPLFSILLLLTVLFIDRMMTSPGIAAPIGLTTSCVLLMLCRPEGIIVFPAVAAFLGWCARKPPDDGHYRPGMVKHLLIASAAFLICLAVYNIWRVSYFGEWLPTPFLSKGGGGESFLFGWKKNMGLFFVEQGYNSPPIGYYFSFLTIIAGIGAFFQKNKTGHERTDQIAFLVSMLYMMIYFNFVDWMPGMRYHVALVGLLLIPAARIQSLLPSDVWQLLAKSQRLRFAVAVLVAILVSSSGIADMKMAGERQEIGIRECNAPLGRWLKDVMPPSSLLAMSDVGATPYYSGFRTIDIHRESLTDLHIAKDGFSDEYILSRNPDVFALVARGVYASKMDPFHYNLKRSPRFKERYRFLGTVRFQWYKDRCYWVYVPIDKKFSNAELARFPGGIGSMRQLVQANP
ncbi:MAG: hypothetical protein GTO51_07295 [Candidatus Latescibacteria bacterium]|nr:hypothetical protein [Candidatus Latescibacterota bacterium]NIM65778.1 hypothetical protein [Candidatus Latescibacterota bacterium]NIO02273.1 hypothetical protein [Candidatus Latescibacterota bacterium]NIO29141.1 hypothetical protein [Candidatus Latescibacterota bacterium]NIO56763.1 hypothetical protein [Candidatus Latescibacterota bacterium]